MKAKKQDSKKAAKLPDDSLKPLKEENDEQPEIFKISKRGKGIDRKDFIKSAAAISSLAALGSLLRGCEESELDIERIGQSCTCHAVCSCDAVSLDEEAEWDNYYDYYYDNTTCTCNAVCTCDRVCTCNTVCTCDSDSSSSSSSGGTYYYTYWYPN